MILLLLILGTVVPVAAQMTDVIGRFGFESALQAQTIKDYNTANKALEKVNLAEALQMKSIEIQTLLLQHDKNISQRPFTVGKYRAFAQKGKKGSDFFIELKDVDKVTCQNINENFAGAKKIEKNKNDVCLNKNIIRFYY